MIGELWYSLAPDDVLLSAAQENELARRMATFDADADAAASWASIDAELSRKW